MRESLFTALFGLACFGSLLLPRPMMYYFGRRFMAGRDEAPQIRSQPGAPGRALHQPPDHRGVGQRLSGRVRDPRSPDFPCSPELSSCDFPCAAGLSDSSYDHLDIPLCERSEGARHSEDRSTDALRSRVAVVAAGRTDGELGLGIASIVLLYRDCLHAASRENVIVPDAEG